MNWLFVTTECPWPMVNGHWLRVYHLARALRGRGDGVSLLWCGPAEDGAEEAYGELGVEFVEGPDRPHIQRGAPRTRLGPYAFDAAMAESVRAAAAGCDAVVLSGARMLQYAPEAAEAGCAIADIVDDPVLERERAGERPCGLMDRLRRLKRNMGEPRYERAFLERVRAFVFVSQEDCESFRRRHPRAGTAFVPNGVDADYFARPADYVRPQGPPTIVFTGHMSNPNNERAATFLVREIAPAVWREVADAKVILVGADPTTNVRALAGDRVEVTGAVEDVRPFLWGATVAAVTMRSGTGIKNKLLEAWAAGAPVVATPVACQGVPSRHGENVLLADEPAQAAARIVEVIRDDALRRRLGEGGRATVVRELTWASVAERLAELARVAGPRGITGESRPCL